MSKKAAAKPAGPKAFSRREREIMEALFTLGKATAAEIRAEISSPPSTTAVRTHLTILEQKGHVRHESDGVRYVYEPVAARDAMGLKAIGQAVRTFFGNSLENAVSALVSAPEAKLSHEELDRLARIIAKARKEGR